MLTAPLVCKDFNSHSCILVKVGTKHARFIPMDGPVLHVAHLPIPEFEKTYTAMDYPVARAAKIYLGSLLEHTELAGRQLSALASGVSLGSLTEEKETDTMATSSKKTGTKGTSRTGGALAQINEYLDKNRDKIKSGELTRKQAIENLVAKGLKKGTVSIETGKWAQKNVQFKKPAKAEKKAPAAKKAAPAKKTAEAKKPATKKVPGTKTKTSTQKPGATAKKPAAPAKKAAAKPAAKAATAKPVKPAPVKPVKPATPVAKPAAAPAPAAAKPAAAPAAAKPAAAPVAAKPAAAPVAAKPAAPAAAPAAAATTEAAK